MFKYAMKEIPNDASFELLEKAKQCEKIDDLKELDKPITDYVSSLETIKEKKFKYDDNGEEYAYDDVLLPDQEYELNGYKYKTDDNARIVECSGTLKTKMHEGRKPLNVNIDEIAWGDQKDNDDRGHVIGDQFEGSNTIGNLTAQNKELNRNDFKYFENELAKEVNSGKKVKVDISIRYSGDSNRPVAYIYNYEIEGEFIKKVFKNEVGK